MRSSVPRHALISKARGRKVGLIDHPDEVAPVGHEDAIQGELREVKVHEMHRRFRLYAEGCHVEWETHSRRMALKRYVPGPACVEWPPFQAANSCSLLAILDIDHGRVTHSDGLLSWL